MNGSRIVLVDNFVVKGRMLLEARARLSLTCDSTVRRQTLAVAFPAAIQIMLPLEECSEQRNDTRRITMEAA